MDAATAIPTRALIVAMAGPDGAIDAQRLYTVAGSLGMTDQQVRLALRRMQAAGAIERGEGRGRRARLQLRDGAVTAVLPEAALSRFAFRRDAGLEPWDGLWRLVAFTVPERERSQRDRLRTRLAFLGGGQVTAALYASPNPWTGLVEAAAEELGVRDALVLATTPELDVGGTTDPPAIAGRLWPLDAVAAGYARLDALLAAPPPAPADPDALVHRLLAMAVELARALTPDPLLPAEVLPAGWAGARSRAAVLDACARLADDARAVGVELPHGALRLLGLTPEALGR